MQNMPALPPKPAGLIALESRRAVIRGQRQEVEAELERLQAEAWPESESDVDPLDPLDAVAERLAAGELESASRDALPEEIEVLRSRFDLLQRAEQKVVQRIAEQRERHNRNIASALRPQHRKAVRRIRAALLELEAANAEEVAVRARVPGVPLQAMTFPNLGSSGAAGGPLRYWLEFAKRLGFLAEDEPEATWPSAAY